MADMPIRDEATPEAKLAAVQDAIQSLRRGGAVTIGGHAMLAVLAAETAGDEAVLAFERAGPSVVLSAERATAVLGRAMAGPAALRPVGRRIDAAMLQALADPTLVPSGAVFETVPLPLGADIGLKLAKLALLLPALLVAPAPGRSGLPPAYVLGHAALSASLLVRVSEAAVPIADMADCRIVAFRAPGTALEHIAILCGRPEEVHAPLVRVHSECFTGDLLGSLRCDCGAQLRGAIRRIAAEGAGAVLYLAQEGRGIGLPNKLRAYALQDHGLDTVDANRALGFGADERDFHVAATMLHQLGMTRIRRLTNNPDKLASLADHGITVESREALTIAANGVNNGYLNTKAMRFGHMLG
jgi:GTP cyclohydrolase II